VQDAGSLLPVALLDIRPGELVCDLCASPGGKATAILEELGEAGWLLVNEPVQSRLPPLLLNLARHGSTRWTLTCMDPADLADALGPVFGAVLVDAPCSAQSLVGRGKQSTRAFDPRVIDYSAARQARILAAALRLLKPGGRLVYSTCTFAWDENERQIVTLIEQCPGLRSFPLPQLSQYEVGAPAPPACYRLWPHRHDCAGVFASRLTVDEVVECDLVPPPPGQRHAGRRARYRRGRALSMRGAGYRPPPYDLAMDAWGTWTRPVRIDVQLERAFGWPHGVPEAFAEVARTGPEVAFRKGRTWFPAYSLAMRRDRAFQAHQVIDVPVDVARRLLRGESVPGPADGWVIVTYEGLPLGWAKGDGCILTNHLPKSARMLLG
jgi:NOL1/NOP2/fmu family ribosome biogenesis protein